jgi:type VI secretion system protein ImpA
MDPPLVSAMKNLAISNGAGEGATCTFLNYQLAQELERETEAPKREKLKSDGRPELADVQATIKASSAEFYQTLLDDLSQCQEALSQVDKVLDEKCGSAAAPSTRNLREAIADIQSLVRSLVKDFFPQLLTRPAEAQAAGSAEQDASGGGSKPGPLASRESALAAILNIAQFFEQTEPHSPIPYALRQIERWGHMPLPELLKELIGDAGARSALFRQVGIREPSKD